MPMPTTASGRRASSTAGLRARLAGAASRTAPLARRHWLFALLLAAGLALRVAAQVAYRPSLVYIDSIKYLFGAYPGNDPPGYQMLLKPVLLIGNPAVAAGIQHLLGLAMAVVLYAVLLRRGAPRWLSALAAAPILLDGYQLQIEQTIMPDVAFEALIVAGLAALLWRPRPSPALVGAAGLALGASATIRQVGEIFILPGLLFLLVAALPHWRALLRNAVIFAAAFALPILAASYKNYLSLHHHFSLAPYAAGTIYGRMAEAADCATLKLPAYERPLCPNAQQKRLGPDGLDHQPESPIKTYVAPPGMHGSAVASNFAMKVATQQPGRVLKAVASDAVKLFALDRATSPGDTPIGRWQFQLSYPQYLPYIRVHDGMLEFAQLTPEGQQVFLGTSRQLGGGPPVVVRPLAHFLRAYQLDGGYTPGPLMAFAVLAGLAGSLSVLRRRARPAQRDAALACLLFFTAGVAVLLVSDLFEFTWRYQLPALVTLPPAAALGLAALGLTSGRRTSGRHAPAAAPAAAPAGPASAAGPSASGNGSQPAAGPSASGNGSQPAAGPSASGNGSQPAARHGSRRQRAGHRSPAS